MVLFSFGSRLNLWRPVAKKKSKRVGILTENTINEDNYLIPTLPSLHFISISLNSLEHKWYFQTKLTFQLDKLKLIENLFHFNLTISFTFCAAINPLLIAPNGPAMGSPVTMRPKCHNTPLKNFRFYEITKNIAKPALPWKMEQKSSAANLVGFTAKTESSLDGAGRVVGWSDNFTSNFLTCKEKR